MCLRGFVGGDPCPGDRGRSAHVVSRGAHVTSAWAGRAWTADPGVCPLRSGKSPMTRRGCFVPSLRGLGACCVSCAGLCYVLPSLGPPSSSKLSEELTLVQRLKRKEKTNSENLRGLSRVRQKIEPELMYRTPRHRLKMSKLLITVTGRANAVNAQKDIVSRGMKSALKGIRLWPRGLCCLAVDRGAGLSAPVWPWACVRVSR